MERIGVGDIRRTLRAHAPRLLGLPNVLYLGIGEKRVGQAGQRRLCARIYVARKTDVPPGSRIPSRLRGVAPSRRGAPYFVDTDVEERPAELDALAISAGDELRGVCRGTIGLAYRSLSGRAFLLTNAHVAAGLDAHAAGERIADPSGEALGVIRRTTPLYSQPLWVHSLDASLVETELPIAALGLPNQPGAIAGLVPLRTGAHTRYFYVVAHGRTRFFSFPERIESERVVRVAGRALRFRDFFELR